MNAARTSEPPDQLRRTYGADGHSHVVAPQLIQHPSPLIRYFETIGMAREFPHRTVRDLLSERRRDTKVRAPQPRRFRATALTRIPIGPSSTASDAVMRSAGALVPAYAAVPGIDARAMVDEILTRALPPSNSRGMASRVEISTP